MWGPASVHHEPRSAVSAVQMVYVGAGFSRALPLLFRYAHLQDYPDPQRAAPLATRHLQSFRSRSCGRGIRSCLQMLEKWGISPWLIWSAIPSRSNSWLFPQTVQPRPRRASAILVEPGSVHPDPQRAASLATRHLQSFRSRSCARGIRSCSQMLEKWGTSPWLIWTAIPSRSNSRLFPQTVQPRPRRVHSPSAISAPWR